MAPALYARDSVENVLRLQDAPRKEHSMTTTSCKLAVNDGSQSLPPLQVKWSIKLHTASPELFDSGNIEKLADRRRA